MRSLTFKRWLIGIADTKYSIISVEEVLVKVGLY